MDDGSIVINTELDTDGFAKDLEWVKNRLAKFPEAWKKQMDNLNKSLAQGFNEDNVLRVAEATKQQFAMIKDTMRSLGQENVFTAQYQKLYDEYIRIEDIANRVKESLKADGLSKDVKKDLTEQFDYLSSVLDKINAKMEELEWKGQKFTPFGETKDFSGMVSALRDIINNYNDYMNKVYDQANKEDEINDKLREQAKLRKQSNFNLPKISSIFGGIKSGLGQMPDFGKKFKTSVGDIFKGAFSTGLAKKLLKPITSFGGMLKRMILRRIMMSIINGVREGMQNLAQYSKGVEANLTTLKSALGQLKNSFATAFAPILSVVTPVLATLINYLSQAVTMIAQFFSALGGSRTFVRAKAYTDSYTKSVGGASKATKELERQLAGFDELEILSANKGGGGGGGGGGVNPSEMFETVEIDGNVSEWVNKLKEAFKAEQWEEVGQIIGQGINGAVEKARGYINFDTLAPKVDETVTKWTTIFNSVVTTIDWEAIGRLLAESFNIAIHTLSTLIGSIDWEAIGNAIFTFIKGAIMGIKIEEIKQLFVNLIKGALNHAIGFLKNGKDIGDILYQLGSIIAGAIDSLSTDEVRSAFERFFITALASVPNIVLGFIQGIVKIVFAGLRAIFPDLTETLNQGEQTILDTLGGWREDYTTWVNDTYGDIINGTETGVTKVEGTTVNGIKSTVDKSSKLYQNMQTTISNSLDGFVTKNKTALNSVDTATQTSVNKRSGYYDKDKGYVEGVSKTYGVNYNAMKEIIDNYTANMSQKTGVISTNYNNIKAYAQAVAGQQSKYWGQMWDDVTTYADQVSKKTPVLGVNYQNMATYIEKAGGKTNSVWKDMGKAFDVLQILFRNGINTIKKNSDLSGVARNMIQGWANGIDNNKSKVIKKATELANSVVSKIKKSLAINSPSRVMRDEVGKMIPLGVAEGIEDTTPKAMKTMGNLADSIADEIDNETYSAQILPEAQMTGFADTIVDGFIALGDRLQAIAERIAYQVPSVANGLMPYGTGAYSSATNNDYEMQRFLSGALVNATNQIVNAINNNGNTTVTVDGNAISETVIDNINRRARQLNASPLVV